MDYILLCISLTACAIFATLIYVKYIVKCTKVRKTKIHPEIPVAQAVIMSPVIVVPSQYVIDH